MSKSSNYIVAEFDGQKYGICPTEASTHYICTTTNKKRVIAANVMTVTGEDLGQIHTSLKPIQRASENKQNRTGNILPVRVIA